MTLQSKKTLLCFAIGLILTWPLLQMWASFRYRVDPWKLCGFAMYAVPQAEYGMQMWGLDAQGRSVVREWSPEVQAAGSAFLERRKTLGRLARPESFARLALESAPHVNQVRIVVRRKYLDPDSALLAEEVDDVRFDRRGRIPRT